MSFLLYSVNFIDEDLRKLQVLKRDANILSIKLEKVIHVVSQFQEHNSIRSLAVSLELDFRLADAESALQYYNVMEKKKSPFRLF